MGKNNLKEKRILHLNVYRKYFNQILSGRKRYEFRARTPYWEKRLLNREYDEVWIANGYKNNRPLIKAKFIKTHCKTFRGISFFAVELGNIGSVILDGKDISLAALIWAAGNRHSSKYYPTPEPILTL